MRKALLALLAAVPLAAQICDPPGKVREAMEGAATPENAPGAQRLARAGLVSAAFPADYFANLFYLDAAGLPSPADVRERYRELREGHPADPASRVLYARSLIGANTREAVPLLEEAAPSFAPALVQLARIHSSPAFHDDARLRADVAAYDKACPDSLAMYAYVRTIDDEAFARDHAAGLRRIVEHRSDTEAVRLYKTLWSMEFKTVPLAGQEPVRDRVRADAARLRAMGPERTDAMKALMAAYRILGDAEGQAWVAQHAPLAVPPDTTEALRTISRWEGEHERGVQVHSQEYWKALLAETDAWIRQWPTESEPRSYRFQALAQIDGAALEEIAKAGDEWLRVYAMWAEPMGFSPYLSAAQVYAEKGMRTAELPGLIEKGVQDMRRTADAPESDLDRHDEAMEASTRLMKWNTLSTGADLDIRLRRYDQAHGMLFELGKSLEGRDAGVVEYRYWYWMARLARAENRTLDALAYERNAIAANLRDAAVAATYPESEAWVERLGKVRAERTGEAHEMWKTLGGSEGAFQAWLAAPPGSAPAAAMRPAVVTAAEPWKQIGKALTGFTLADAQGKTWQLAELKGKVTLVNVWATWCAPCREELPYVQKLYEAVRGRGDLAVVTLNIDDNPGLIEPFLKEHRYTFPALPALDYATRLGLGLGVPRNWIVSADGVVVQERVGAGSPDGRWVADMIARMEKARSPR